jgi:hypothetical protein
VGLLGSRAGTGAAKRALRGIPSWEVNEGISMAEATEQTFTTMGHPSRLALGLIATVAAVSDVGEDDPRFPVLLASGSMGYACRVTYPRELPDGVVAAIEAGLPRTADGAIDFDGLEDSPDHFRRLIDWSSHTAGDPFDLNALSGCSVGTWQALSVTAGYSIRENALKRGLNKRLLLSLDEIDDLLRIGYTLRVIDEVAGLEPQHELFS